MKSLPSSFPILAEKHVAKDAFVEYWASKYQTTFNESKYQDNIGTSLNRRASVRSAGPVWRYSVHFRQPGLGILPSSPA